MKNTKEESIFELIAKSELKKIITDIDEYSFDKLLEDGLLKDIPFMKWLQSGYNIYNDVQNHFFEKKIFWFLDGTKNVSKNMKMKFAKSLSDPKIVKRLEERLLLIINNINDYRKSKLLGAFYQSLVSEEITSSEFFRIAEIIERVFFDDYSYLVQFNLKESHEGFDSAGEIPRELIALTNVGLLTDSITIETAHQWAITSGGGPPDYYQLRNFETSELGTIFIKTFTKTFTTII